ncbi:outer membrane protein assembly factor BamD [Desulfocurvus sp. DL9XJH121]
MRKILGLVCLVGMLVVLPGCGIIDYYFLPAPEDTAQELFEAGMNAMQEKSYDNAAEYFQSLKDRYPFSPYTTKAELSLADARFLGEEYQLAADAYTEFEALHPRHEMIEYVLYQIGLSNYKLSQGIDRPQTNVDMAIEYFRRLVGAFPESKYVPQAEIYLKDCRRLLAEHEVFIADFYWRAEEYGPAWERYNFIKDNFQDMPEIAAYAEKRAKISWLRHQEQSSEAERERIQGSWKQWFDWL